MGTHLDLTSFFVYTVIVLIGVCMGNLIVFKLILPRIELLQLKLGLRSGGQERVKAVLQMTFGAYERLLLLCHRIQPSQVILRQHQPGLALSLFLKNSIADLDAEYQHNLTQQLYVSDLAWLTVTTLKENTVKLFYNTASGLSEDTTVDAFIAVLSAHMKGLQKDPYLEVQALLKQEMLR